jgi:hypothetical protein
MTALLNQELMVTQTHTYLIRQEPVSDVCVAELHCCLQRFLIVAAVVVALIALSQALQDLQRLLLTGLQNIHRLETPATQNNRTAVHAMRYVTKQW